MQGRQGRQTGQRLRVGIARRVTVWQPMQRRGKCSAGRRAPDPPASALPARPRAARSLRGQRRRRRASTARSLWRKRRCWGAAARPPSVGLVVGGPIGARRPMDASRIVRGADAASGGASVLTESLVGTREVSATASFARHPPPACMQDPGGGWPPTRTVGLETLWRAVAAARMLAKVQNMNRGCKPGGCGMLCGRLLAVNSQGLQGSHLNLSQASAQRHRRYFLLNNKAVNIGGIFFSITRL